MNKTTNYQLNQWEPEDQVRRTDFNEDNAKLDAALAGKAEKAALTALQAQVASVQALAAGKGSCNILIGSYTGAGTPTVTLNLGVTPKAVLVAGGNEHALFVYGAATTSSTHTNNARMLSVTWTEQGVTWRGVSSWEGAAMNSLNTVYGYVVLY